MNYFFAIANSIFYIGLAARILFVGRRRAKFWPIFLVSEYFYVIGIGLFPLLLYTGLVEIPPMYINYANIDSISILTILHISCYLVGAFFGFFLLRKYANFIGNRLVKISMKMELNPIRFFYLLTFFAISSSLLYFAVVGVERGLMGASASRSGVFTQFEGFEGYLFLKRFTILGLYAVAVFPYILSRGKRVRSSLFIFLVVGILGYLSTVSRFALFETVITPALLYFAYGSKAKLKRFLYVMVVSIFGFFVFIYGKEFVGLYSNYYYNGGALDFVGADVGHNFLDAFSHLFFSIDAGVKHFLDVGLYFPRDVLLSVFGIVPSGFLSYMGMENFSYQLVERSDIFSCVNSDALVAIEGCVIPPYYTGASAYMFPLIGGFIFGLIRFFIYAVMQRTWILLDGNERYLVLPYLLFIVIQQILLFIPSTVSLAIFFALVMLLYLYIGRKFKFTLKI